MAIQRCPECGIRLKTNYCDICMKRVPFNGMPAKQTFQHHEGSSAHRMERGHECVSFEDKKKRVKTTFAKPGRKPALNQKKGASVAAIVLAVISLLSTLIGLMEDTVGDSAAEPMPEYSVQEGLVAAGDPGAEDVPAVFNQELYNKNGLQITADAAGLNNGEYTILMTICNETGRNLTVNGDWFSVNGYMYTYGISHGLGAGHTVQTALIFYADEMENADINQIGQVEFVLNVYDDDTFEEVVIGELLTIETEAAEAITQPDVHGWELYNDGSVNVLVRDMQMSGYGDATLDLYIENLSDSTASVYLNGVRVNGQEVSGYLWTTLRPDKRDFESIYLYELENMDITEWEQVEEITLDLYVEYMDELDIVENHSESITFDPNAMR